MNSSKFNWFVSNIYLEIFGKNNKVPGSENLVKLLGPMKILHYESNNNIHSDTFPMQNYFQLVGKVKY